MSYPYERPQDLQVEVCLVEEARRRPHQVGDDHSGGAIQTFHSMNEDSPILQIYFGTYVGAASVKLPSQISSIFALDCLPCLSQTVSLGARCERSPRGPALHLVPCKSRRRDGSLET